MKLYSMKPSQLTFAFAPALSLSLAIGCSNSGSSSSSSQPDLDAVEAIEASPLENATYSSDGDTTTFLADFKTLNERHEGLVLTEISKIVLKKFDEKLFSTIHPVTSNKINTKKALRIETARKSAEQVISLLAKKNCEFKAEGSLTNENNYSVVMRLIGENCGMVAEQSWTKTATPPNSSVAGSTGTDEKVEIEKLEVNDQELKTAIGLWKAESHSRASNHAVTTEMSSETKVGRMKAKFSYQVRMSAQFSDGASASVEADSRTHESYRVSVANSSLSYFKRNKSVSIFRTSYSPQLNAATMIHNLKIMGEHEKTGLNFSELNNALTENTTMILNGKKLTDSDNKIIMKTFKEESSPADAITSKKSEAEVLL